VCVARVCTMRRVFLSTDCKCFEWQQLGMVCTGWDGGNHRGHNRCASRTHTAKVTWRVCASVNCIPCRVCGGRDELAGGLMAPPCVRRVCTVGVCLAREPSFFQGPHRQQVWVRVPAPQRHLYACTALGEARPRWEVSGSVLCALSARVDRLAGSPGPGFGLSSVLACVRCVVGAAGWGPQRKECLGCVRARG
jgi:hypothetical protein